MPAAKKEEQKPKTLTIQVPTVSLSLDEGLKPKLPLLFLILLFFAFSAFLFDKANFHTTDLVDLPRLQYNVSKFYSVAFLLFLVLFSLDLALSVHFGFGLNRLTSLLVLPATLLPALLLGFMFPKLMLVFIAFSLTTTAASFFAAGQKELTFSSAWGTIGKALLLFALLAFAVAYLRFSEKPSFYSEKLFESTLGLMPDVGKQLSSALQSAEVDESLLRSLVSKETFQKSITTDRVQAAIERIPGITSFNASLREKWAQQVREQMTSDAAYEEFIKTAVETVKEIKTKFAEQIENQTAAPDKSLSTMAMAQAKKIPQLKLVLDNFAWIAAFSVLSVVSVINFAIKLLSSILAWALKKIAFS